MYIEKLVIYGFGKHENVTIDLGPQMNVLYGHNESGKTTIQQFILHVLFGFPPRNSSLLRYEPKSGGKYGGQIHLKDEEFGKCVIERIRGKSAGDVIVYLENGEVGGEEVLAKLLRQYDRAAFESIFSFSLLQLQDFEKMNEEELSRTLLASGTTGVDHLVQIEEKMQKEMGEIFKKGGRKPELNQRLVTLKNLETSLQEARRKADQYAPKMKRLEEVEEALLAIQQQKEEDEKALRQLTIEQQQLPLQREKAQLQEQLVSLEEVHFPVDGIQRYESIKRQLGEVNASITSVRKTITQIDDRRQEQLDKGAYHALIQLLEQESQWHRSLSSHQALVMEDEQLIERAHQLRARLGITSEELLRNADVSIRKEEELYELLENLQGLHREREEVEKKQGELEETLERLTAKEREVPPPSQEEIKQAQSWPAIRQQLLEAKAFLSMHTEQKRQLQLIRTVVIVFVLFVAAYGLFSQQYLITVIVMIGGGATYYFTQRGQQDGRLAEMQHFLQSYEGREGELDALLERVEKYQRAQAVHKEERENIHMDRQRLENLFYDITQDTQQTERALQGFLAAYGIDGLPSATIIPELFRMIREIQEVMHTRHHKEAQRQQLEQAIREIHQEGEQVLQQQIPQEALYEWIRKEEKRLSDLAQQDKIDGERKAQLTEELEEKEALEVILTRQMTALFEEAAVKTEGAYYEADQQQGKKEQLTQQVASISTQLGNVPATDLTLTDEEIENMIKERTNNITVLNKEQKALVEERAMLINETHALLSDEAASALQQEFEMARAEFSQLAKQWAAKQALATAIGQMMADLKEKKFPAVLANATQLFAMLTGNRYKAMTMTEEGYFEVVSHTGMRFPIVELSQATKEQAYIALRLALAEAMKETAPFPIIMDDPFVHFDEVRLRRMAEVIEQMHDRQLIYFTCHEEMKETWQKARTINVSTIGTRQGAIHE